LQIRRKGFEYSGFDGEERKLPFPANVDQAACLEFLDVMGEGSGRDGKGLVGHGAGERTLSAGNVLEQFEALWVRQCLEDGGALGAGEAG
jgi:hypothetical protein